MTPTNQTKSNQIKQVVETVVARLETRLAKSRREGGDGGAAAAAVAGKLDKARRMRPPTTPFCSVKHAPMYIHTHTFEGILGHVNKWTEFTRCALHARIAK